MTATGPEYGSGRPRNRPVRLLRLRVLRLQRPHLRLPRVLRSLLATHEDVPDWPASKAEPAHGPDGPRAMHSRHAARNESQDPGIGANIGASISANAGEGWSARWRRSLSAPLRTLEQRSLFGEILDWMFAPLLLLWPLSVAVTFVVARSLADAPYDRALIDRTEALAQQVRVNQRQVFLTLPNAARDILTQDDTDQVYFQVIGPRGNLLSGEAELPMPDLYDYPDPGRVKLRNARFGGDEIRIGYLYLPVQIDGYQEIEELPRVLVQLAETLDKRNRLANEIIKGVIFPQFVILPLAMMLVWFGLSRGLAPLELMQRRIRNRRPYDLSPIDPLGAPQEIAPLVDSFNDLLQRLRETVDVQKRFIADAAHQMKTPLAGLSTQSELALHEINPEDQRRRLEQLALSSRRAAHLINQLLALARTENLAEALVREPVNLVDFTRSVVSDWVPAALDRSIDLGFEAGSGRSWVDGHPILLRELYNNLIDNALRYTPAGGSVTVRIRCDARNVWLEVEDSGPGVPESERRLVFERFYRVLGTQVDGSGLGLAIVREIAGQHRADVWIETVRPVEAMLPVEAMAGARFVVEFPAARVSSFDL